MGALLDTFSTTNRKLSPFKRSKLLHEFFTFFDVNKDGCLDARDLRLAKSRICKMSGLQPGDSKYQDFEDLFREMWKSLQQDADVNRDERITVDEWLSMWETIQKETARRSALADGKRVLPRLCFYGIDDISDSSDQSEDNSTELPQWLKSYLKYKFNLYDRTGDGLVDEDEFVYVLSMYEVAEKDARRAWLIFTENNTKRVDFHYFCQLTEEYFLSDDPASLGNFITGRLDFDHESTR